MWHKLQYCVLCIDTNVYVISCDVTLHICMRGSISGVCTLVFGVLPVCHCILLSSIISRLYQRLSILTVSELAMRCVGIEGWGSKKEDEVVQKPDEMMRVSTVQEQSNVITLKNKVHLSKN